MKKLSVIGFSLLLGACASQQVERQQPQEQSPPTPPVAVEKASVDAKSEKAALLAQIKQREPQSKSAKLYYHLLMGEFAGKRDMLDIAVEQYLAASELTDDEQVARRAARIAVYAHDEKNAITAVRRWLELAPDSVEAHQTITSLYMRDDLVRQAQPHLLFLLKKPQVSLTNHLKLALLMSEVKDTKLASQVLAEIHQQAELEKDLHFAHYSRAFLALKQLEYQEALTQIEESLKHKPQWIEAETLRAQILLENDQLDKAIAYLKEIVDAKPDHWELRFNYLRSLIKARQFDKSLEQVKILSKSKVSNMDFLYTSALVGEITGDKDVIDKSLGMLKKLGKPVDESYYYLGEVAAVENLHTESIKLLEKVGKGDLYLDAQLEISEQLYKQGNLVGALARITDLSADYEEDWERLALAEGGLLFRAEKYPAALEVYSRALKKSPNNTDLLYERGLVYEKLDDIASLEQDFRIIIGLEPNNAHALNALGYTLADRTTRFDEAKIYIDRAFKLLPDNAAIVDSLGWLQFKKGNIEESIHLLKRAFYLEDDAEIGAHLGEALWLDGQKDEAIVLLKKLSKTNPDHESLNRLLKRLDIRFE